MTSRSSSDVFPPPWASNMPPKGNPEDHLNWLGFIIHRVSKRIEKNLKKNMTFLEWSPPTDITSDAYSDITSGILFDICVYFICIYILFGILSDILYSSSLRWTWRPKKIHPYIFSIFNVHVNEQESTFYLAFSLTWCIFWHSIWNSLWHSIWHLAKTMTSKINSDCDNLDNRVKIFKLRQLCKIQIPLLGFLA